MDASSPSSDANIDVSSRPDSSVVAEAGVPDVVPPPPADDVSIDIVQPPSDGPFMCDGSSPIISIQRINGDKVDACTGQLAAHTFTHVLCTCEDLRTTFLTTESFDSNLSGADASTTNPWGAAVGVGGSDLAARYQNVGGSLTIAGTETEFVLNGVNVGGDLRIAGKATLLMGSTILRDAWATGSVATALGFAYINRNLNLGPGATFQGTALSGGVTVKGVTNQLTSPVAIENPCGCGASDKLDVSAIVTTGSLRNDNARVPLDPTVLNDVGAAGAQITLNCGRFYLEKIGGIGPTTLHITGRVALFVGGNVQASDLFQLQVDPGAELDLFIRGNITLLPAAGIGNSAKPSATRIYVAGSGDIQIPGVQTSLNLYAPNANVVVGASVVVGSIYARNLTTGNSFVARYDRSILSQGLRCDVPTTCDKCHTCNGGTACVNGTCTTCQQDSDCCAPLVCDQGACLPLH